MRSKIAITTKKRRKKVLKQAKGYYLAKHKLFKTAKEQLMNAYQNAYDSRRKNKSKFRALWNIRINAALSPFSMSYSKFIYELKKNNILLNRKMLSEIAINYGEVFKEIVDKVKDK